MKKFYTFLMAFVAALTFAQIPQGYYDGTAGLTGYALKTKLSQIITNGHRDTGYNWITINSCDRDLYYENDNSILDIYSENPTGTDPYNFTAVTNQCGNHNSETDCYNREHIMPQGFFGAAPMESDYHHIIATDGYVNSKRGNYPFGEVGTATWTSMNGSKLGTSVSPGYGGTVFEPIDEFKGDVARMLLYFITRYETRLPTFSVNDANNPLDGSTDRGFEQWYINLLLSWHLADAVSPKEIARNNCVYGKQGNRNPYIDHPEYVTMIWTSTLSTTDAVNGLQTLRITPNPVKNQHIEVAGLSSKQVKAEIFSLTGQLVQTAENISKNSNRIQLKNLPKGVYILKAGSQSVKFIIE